MLLRLGPLLRALAGPPLAQFQQLMFAYEEQCGIEGVDPIVSPWRVFLGGSEPHPANLLTVLQEQSPEPAQDRQVFKQ